MPAIITRGAASAQGFGFGSGLGPADPYFNQVPLLLNGDGAANGSQNNTFLDSSTNNFTVTNNNNVLQGTPNPFNGQRYSNYLNGSSYLTLPANSVLLNANNFTVEFWINPSSVQPSSRTPIINFGAFGTNFWAIQLNNVTPPITNQIQFWSYNLLNNNPVAVASGTISASIWTHVAVVRNGTNFQIYINGVSKASATYSGSVDGGSTTNQLQIGYSSPDYYSGYISNLRIANSAVYTSNFTPSTGPLTAISGTLLLTSQSNRFVDNSTNNFTITPTGTPTVNLFGPFLPTKPYSTTVNGGTGYFNGTSNYLSVTNSTALNPGTGNFTFECWVYLNSTLSSQVEIYEAQANGIGVFIYSSGILGLSQSFVAVLLTDTVAMPFYQWVHVAVVRSGTTLSLFKNGIRVATTTNSTNFVTSTINYIGRLSTGNYFPGYISNLRMVIGTAVYNPSLTTLTVPTAPLTAITNTALLLNNTNSGIPELSQNNVVQTVSTASVSTSVVKYGTGSLKFNGTSDYLSLPYNPAVKLGSSNFTIEFWAYFNSVAASQTILADTITASTGFSWVFFTSTGRLDYYLSSNGTAWNIASAVPIGNVATGQWYHVALVRNGSTFTPYLNGVSGTTTTSALALYVNSSADLIGAGPGGINFFNGYLDDVRITNGIARYTANFTPPTAALPTY
jgi:hypothetical protein